MYFKSIPKIYYPFTIDGTERYVILKNITVNARFIKDILSNISLYDMYDIREGETPEIIADKFYGSSTYHWIVMLANDRYDNINDWPLSYNDLIKYCQDKYGETGMYQTHHYENAEGYVVNDDWLLATPISYFTYEERINESKRTIKIIDKAIIEQIASEYVSKMTA